MIDSLVLKPTYFLTLSSILDSTRALGIDVKRVSLKEGLAYRIGTWQSVHVFYSFEATRVYKIQTKPSAFDDVSSYLGFLLKVLGEKVFHTSRITRIDFAVDYPIPFEKILSGFDVPRKQNVHFTVRTRSGKPNHLMLGGGSRSCVVYDKQQQKNLPKSLTRLEVRLSKQTLPVRSLEKLSSLVARIVAGRYRPLRDVQLSTFVAIGDREILEVPEAIRFGRLTGMVLFSGFSIARRQLNANGNFRRDFRKFFKLEPVSPSPCEKLVEQLHLFSTSREIPL